MAVKMINPAKGKNVGIISNESRNKILDRIKTNYTLFGNSNSFYVMDFTLQFINFTKFINKQAIEITNIAKFRGYRNKDGKIKLNSNFNKLGDKLCQYSLTNTDLYISNEDIFYNLSSGNDVSISQEASLSVSFNDNKLEISGFTEYSENDKSLRKVTTTNIEINNDVIELNSLDTALHFIVIFPGAKSAPIIRLYDDDEYFKSKKTWVDSDSLLDQERKMIANNDGRKYTDILVFFDDSTNTLYNSYFRKYDIRVEEKSVLSDNKNIECMKYNDKANDILQYLKHENYTFNPKTKSAHFENDLGISSDYCEKHELENDEYYKTIYRVKYKNDIIYGVTNKLNAKDETMDSSDIKYFKKTVYNDKKEALYIDENCTDISDDKEISDYVIKIYNAYISDWHSSPLPEIKAGEFKVYSDNTENRIFVSIIKDSLMINIQIINDYTLYYSIIEKQGYISVLNTYLVDIHNNIRDLIFNTIKQFSTTVDSIRIKITYIDKNKLMYTIMNIINSVTGKISHLYYSGPECTVDVDYDEDGNPILKSIDSLIYSSSDKMIYIRDEMGMPSLLSIH